MWCQPLVRVWICSLLNLTRSASPVFSRCEKICHVTPVMLPLFRNVRNHRWLVELELEPSPLATKKKSLFVGNAGILIQPSSVKSFVTAT